MIHKLLRLDEYNKYFELIQPETGCGIENDQTTGDNYFFIQTFLPDSYFDINRFQLFGNPFLKNGDFADEIHVKFELFAIGVVNELKAFVFKPWIINVENPYLLDRLENFILYIPEKLFLNLVICRMFLGEITREQIQDIQIFRDISGSEFKNYGITKMNSFKTSRFSYVPAIWTNSQKEIEKFYERNEVAIPPNLINSYFDDNLNLWYGIIGNKSGKTYGFVRLYNKKSTFTGGFNVEYIVEQTLRNKGVATEALKGLLKFLKEESSAFWVHAEVLKENEASIIVLRKSGFIEVNGNNLFDCKYVFNLIRLSTDRLEQEYNNENLNFGIHNTYIEKFKRYST